MRKYIEYLTEQLKYWKKRVQDTEGYTKVWAEQRYETFREKIEKENKKENETDE